MTNILNIDEYTVKSFKTKENLEASLAKKGLDKFRYIVVCNSSGRFTAIFPASELTRNDIAYMGYFAQFGYITLG